MWILNGPHKVVGIRNRNDRNQKIVVRAVILLSQATFLAVVLFTRMHCQYQITQPREALSMECPIQHKECPTLYAVDLTKTW